MEKLLQALKEKSLEIAPDYPGIETAEPEEQLYAISSSYEGTKLANNDLHKLIKVLRLRLRSSQEEVSEISREIIEGKIGPEEDMVEETKDKEEELKFSYNVVNVVYKLASDDGDFQYTVLTSATTEIGRVCNWGLGNIAKMAKDKQPLNNVSLKDITLLPVLTDMDVTVEHKTEDDSNDLVDELRNQLSISDWVISELQTRLNMSDTNLDQVIEVAREQVKKHKEQNKDAR